MEKDEVKLYPLVYSAPRRFDLATVLVVSIAYALLFTLMRLLDLSAGWFVWFAGLVTVVAALQALLFGGNKPREASVLGGLAYAVITMAVVLTAIENSSGCELFTALLGGPILGYLAGALVGGVFLIADALRSKFDRNISRRFESETNSPWDEPEESEA